eukprot:749203-Hanusia_phi.AAC.1
MARRREVVLGPLAEEEEGGVRRMWERKMARMARSALWLEGLDSLSQAYSRFYEESQCRNAGQDEDEKYIMQFAAEEAARRDVK